MARELRLSLALLGLTVSAVALFAYDAAGGDVVAVYTLNLASVPINLAGVAKSIV